jgi:flagellar protein FlgJ
MSINPGSDIVVDVMRAADPARAEQMTARLDALGAMSPTDPAAFSKALADTTAGGTTSIYSRAEAAAQNGAAGDAKDSKAKTAFESAIINNFVKEMLPKDASSVYGQGEAGDIWRSMLSEQISNQIAKSGELGISKKLFSTHALHPHGKTDPALTSARQLGEDAAQSSAHSLSLAPGANVVDGAVLFKSKATS